MADEKGKNKKKDLLRKLREYLLSLSKGAKTGGRPGLTQIEQLEAEENPGKKKKKG